MATNLYKQFLRLIPQAPLQVGDVVSLNNGEAIIALPGGGTTSARGEAQIGDLLAYVRKWQPPVRQTRSQQP